MKKSLLNSLKLLTLSPTVPLNLMVNATYNFKVAKDSNYEFNNNPSVLTNENKRWEIVKNNIDQTIITSIVDTDKDTNYPWQNEYTNKRAAGNDFNLSLNYWHTSKIPLMVGYVDAYNHFGYPNLDEFFKKHSSIKLNYIYNYNFWFQFLSQKTWILNQDSPKKVSFDKWEKASFEITKNSEVGQKIESGINLFDNQFTKFNIIKLFDYMSWSSSVRQLPYFMAAGVHVWHEIVNNQVLYIFAEVGAFLEWHKFMWLKEASYMNFKAISLEIN